jgi:O-antigen/teichoic acid export membrane protein
MTERNKVVEALPEGTLEVGVGLVVAGITAYAFLSLAKHGLTTSDGDTSAYGPLGVLWAVMFTAGPGFFLPIEQEVTRALSARRARGEGSGPLLRKAALLGAGLLGVLMLATLAAGPLIVKHFFSDQWLLLLGLELGLVGYWMGHLSRGTLSGLGRFRPYSVYIGAEGAVRLVLCVVLVVIGVSTAGVYGIAVGIGPIIAVLIAMRGQRGLATPGPDAPWSELSSSLGALLVGSVLAQTLLNAGVPAIELLSHEGDSDKVGVFFVAVVISRLPLFLFQAVQAALLPKLSSLASAGRLDEFREGFKRLCIVVAGVGAFGTVGALLVGPKLVDVFFQVDLSHRDLGLLAAGSAAYMLAIAIAQALIALHGQKQVALCWLCGIVAFVVATALGHDLYLRVEVGLLVGSVAALAAMTLCVVSRVRAGAIVTTPDLLEALHDVPLEP